MKSIDIVTITFNSEMHLRRCLESVRRVRDYITNYIVIDGGSTDKTIEIIEEFSDIITTFISERDRGISDAFNKGILRCSSDYILLLNSDDWIIHEHARNIFENIDENDEVICTTMLSYSDGTYLGEYNSNPSYIQKYNSMLHPGCIVSSKVYKRLGLYDLSLKVGMDYDFFCRCFISGIPFKLINAPLIAFNEGGTSRKRKYLILKESFALRKRYHGAIFPLHESKQLISRILGDALDCIGMKSFIKRRWRKHEF